MNLDINLTLSINVNHVITLDLLSGGSKQVKGILDLVFGEETIL
jgi:hypothetical protein